MLGLFGTLDLGARSLATQRQGTEIAGHNLANVNNPAYARQRLSIETSLTIPTQVGPQGTGADGVSIRQLRDALLDNQIQSETSVRGSLDAQQRALQYLQAALGQRLDRQATGAEGAAAAGGVTSQHGLAENLSELFNAFQSLSANPSSLAERQVLLQKAQDLTTQFGQVASRTDSVRSNLNAGIQNDAAQANRVLADIAKLNHEIITTEVGGVGVANDLRDMRQQKLEDLAKLVNYTAAAQANGSVNVTIGGTAMVTGSNQVEQLEAYDSGGGQWLVRAQSTSASLTLTSGTIQGAIDIRDGALASLRSDLNALASNLISEVNGLHTAGFSLTGTTGAAFFTGTDAATIRVNTALTANPSLIQASGVNGATGDNQVVLALAQLADKRVPALNNQTFHESYGQTVSSLGQSLLSVNTQLSNQEVVQQMLARQRDSMSGVSLDEEMTDLVRFQKAYQASARLITTVDEMLAIVVNLGRV